MGDERERMSQDIEGLRKRLLVVNERWEVVCADLKAENARLRAIVEKASATDDVAHAYQQVYFEDERRWQDERAARIKAEAKSVALRDALRALVDATEPQVPLIGADEYWEACSDARTAAVRLLLPETATELTGQNLGDSGMAEPGGVSDGPQ